MTGIKPNCYVINGIKSNSYIMTWIKSTLIYIFCWLIPKSCFRAAGELSLFCWGKWSPSCRGNKVNNFPAKEKFSKEFSRGSEGIICSTLFLTCNKVLQFTTVIFYRTSPPCQLCYQSSSILLLYYFLHKNLESHLE